MDPKNYIIVLLMVGLITSGFCIEFKDDRLFGKDDIFYPEVGVYLENTGIMFTYQDYVNIPITYLSPIDFRSNMTSNHCDYDSYDLQDTILGDISQTFKSDLKEKYPIYDHVLAHQQNKRNKRNPGLGLAIAATGILTGITVGNIFQAERIRTNVQDLDSKINLVYSKTTGIEHNLDIVTEGLNNISKVIIPNVIDELNKIQCETIYNLDYIHLSALIKGYFVLMSNRISRIMNSLYDNKLTPDLIIPQEAKKLISRYHDLQNSMYADDINLLYLLGKGVLVSVRHDPFSLSIILVLPKIQRSNLGVIMSVHTVPIMDSVTNSSTVLQVGNHVVRDIETHNIWIPDEPPDVTLRLRRE